MAAATGVIGPVVRMCDDPGCGGMFKCERANPLMGLSENVPLHSDLSDEDVCALLRQEISLNPASDDAGVQRMVPDGCEFVVHKVDTDGLGYGMTYAAVYSGPARNRDEALAGSPEWDHGAAVERLKRMRTGGVAPT